MYGGYRRSGSLWVPILAAFGLLWLVFKVWFPESTSFSNFSDRSRNPLVGNANQIGRGLPTDLRPNGNPLNDPRTVMTQGYGVGTHAPAHVWGAIDLAIDGDGDGYAEPGSTQDTPIYATHDGVVRVTPNSVPAGNHIWVSNDSYRTGYAHLSGFAVKTGDRVRRGDLIGYVGSTGQSSGPHLDYQIWALENGQWVNKNPLDFNPLP